MHTHPRRAWGFVVVTLVVIVAHALLLYLFLEARLSAVLVGGLVIVAVVKYVVRKLDRSR